MIEGPRWAGIPKFVKDESFIQNLTLTQFEVDTGWILETVRFEVIGEDVNVDAFRKLFLEALDDYNNERIKPDDTYS